MAPAQSSISTTYLNPHGSPGWWPCQLLLKGGEGRSLSFFFPLVICSCSWDYCQVSLGLLMCFSSRADHSMTNANLNHPSLTWIVLHIAFVDHTLSFNAMYLPTTKESTVFISLIYHTQFPFKSQFLIFSPCWLTSALSKVRTNMYSLLILIISTHEVCSLQVRLFSLRQYTAIQQPWLASKYTQSGLYEPTSIYFGSGLAHPS